MHNSSKLNDLREFVRSLEDPHCGHSKEDLVSHGFKSYCRSCGSYWDTESLAQKEEYGLRYLKDRLHDSEGIGSLKVASLRRWLAQAKINPAGLNVCEVGFGGGHSLQYLNGIASHSYGIEATTDHLRLVAKLGIAPNQVFQFSQKPKQLPNRIDLWLFQDSFEHLDDPSRFMQWVLNNSSSQAKLLMILPRADSLSQKILGRYWPHKLIDHKFHWSKSGLSEFMNREGFKLQKSFYPLKKISLQMALCHWQQKFSTKLLPIKSNFNFWFNFGEMGCLFIRRN